MCVGRPASLSLSSGLSSHISFHSVEGFDFRALVFIAYYFGFPSRFMLFVKFERSSFVLTISACLISLFHCE